MQLRAVMPVVLALVLFAGCTSTSPTPKQAVETRDFYVFNGGLDFNETTVGVPHDMFVPDHIVVNKGDTVSVHFYNTEETENHTITFDAPYTSNHVVPPAGWANFTFVADTAGVFWYRCTEHQPTMTGQLIVMG